MDPVVPVWGAVGAMVILTLRVVPVSPVVDGARVSSVDANVAWR